MTKVILLWKMHRWEYVLLKETCVKSRRHLSLQSGVIFSAVPFQAYLKDDGNFDSSSKRRTVLQVEHFWFCLFSCNLLVLSAFGKSDHLQRRRELEHSCENLWERNHEALAREVLWDPWGLPKSGGTSRMF